MTSGPLDRDTAWVVLAIATDDGSAAAEHQNGVTARCAGYVSHMAHTYQAGLADGGTTWAATA